MGSYSDDSRTLDLISCFDRPIQMENSDNAVSNRNSKKRKRNSSYHHAARPNKVKRKEIVFSNVIEMPTLLKNRIAEMGGFDIKIVTQKQLQDTDVNENHDRLMIPTKKLLNGGEDEENNNEMEVLIVDPLLRESVVELQMWKTGSGETFCLTCGWNSLARLNSLECGDYIQLWSFRTGDFVETQTVTSNLCFALVKLDISEGIIKFI